MELRGYIPIFFIQILQVIIVIIHGEPIKILAGVLCGGFIGLLLCLSGSIAGTVVIFAFMRSLGKPILDRISMEKNLQQFNFMHDSRKLETVTLLLFLLPGTPKDMLTYIAGTTSIPMPRFVATTSSARIPSIVTSTYIGHSAPDSNWYAAVLLILVTLTIGIMGSSSTNRQSKSAVSIRPGIQRPPARQIFGHIDRQIAVCYNNFIPIPKGTLIKPWKLCHCRRSLRRDAPITLYKCTVRVPLKAEGALCF